MYPFATTFGGWGNAGERNRSQYDTVEKLVAGVEASLRRLDTDHLDLIQCHIFYPEPNTPVFIEGFRKLKRDGKVRAFGVSTSDLDHLKTFNAEGDCDALQVDYSILNRTPEADLFPYCLEHNIGVIVRGPLAMGILTGKFHDETTFAEGDFRQAWTTDPDQRKTFLDDLSIVERIDELTGENETLAQLALRFTLAHEAVTTVIPGARNPKQAGENIRAGALGQLEASTMNQINAIVPPKGGRKIWPA
jgi:aryl-alcohol dehydrogenase-like predicted oxidoreductase